MMSKKFFNFAAYYLPNQKTKSNLLFFKFMYVVSGTKLDFSLLLFMRIITSSKRIASKNITHPRMEKILNNPGFQHIDENI